MRASLFTVVLPEGCSAHSRPQQIFEGGKREEKTQKGSESGSHVHSLALLSVKDEGSWMQSDPSPD